MIVCENTKAIWSRGERVLKKATSLTSRSGRKTRRVSGRPNHAVFRTSIFFPTFALQPAAQRDSRGAPSEAPVSNVDILTSLSTGAAGANKCVTELHGSRRRVVLNAAFVDSSVEPTGSVSGVCLS